MFLQRSIEKGDLILDDMHTTLNSYQSGKGAMIFEIQEEAIKWYREAGRVEAV